MKKLQGRVALVTGAARGIGRGCAHCLASEGADIAINDLARSRDDAEDCAGEIKQMGNRAVVVPGDMGTLQDVDQVVQETIEHYGELDILVSNVAYEVHSGLLDASLEDVDRTLEVTLLGAFRLAQQTAKHMVERRQGGKIIFITSIHAEVPFGNAIAYNTAKAGLNHLARSMANELAPHRINVNTIAPGWIDTPGERRWNSDEDMRRLGDRLPWGRMGTPADIGKAAAYLASDDADYVTGTVLKVDGGYTASLKLDLD